MPPVMFSVVTKYHKGRHSLFLYNSEIFLCIYTRYFTLSYYQTTPKKITVINAKGINAYRKVNLTSKVRHYRKGTVLKIKAVKQHGITTRLILTNGTYITANKTMVLKK